MIPGYWLQEFALTELHVKKQGGKTQIKPEP